MEQRLKVLFDYQKFKNDARLAHLITACEERYEQALDDDALSVVSAAGDPFANLSRDEDEGGNGT